MTERVTDDLLDKIRATIAVGVSDDAMKGIKKKVDDILYDIEGDVMYRLKDAIAPELAGFVAEMTERTINALLEGNERELRRYLSCENRTVSYTGRSTGYSTRSLDDFHPVIHGKLHEGAILELRRKIVDAHRDLLVNERILDLEDQVKSLVAQVNKANAEKAEMWERVRHLT